MSGNEGITAVLGQIRQVLAANQLLVLTAEPGVKLDYAELVDADSFEQVPVLRRACYMLLAAIVGNTRLIDNAIVG